MLRGPRTLTSLTLASAPAKNEATVLSAII